MRHIQPQSCVRGAMETLEKMSQMTVARAAGRMDRVRCQARKQTPPAMHSMKRIERVSRPRNPKLFHAAK